MAVQEISKAQASEYEHIVLVDKSGSMGSPSKRIPGKTRWEEAQEHISGLCQFLSDIDENGIDLILFSGATSVYRNVKNADEVVTIFKEVTPKGSTDLAAALNEAGKIREANSGRGFFIHVLTDGIPDSESAAADAIARMVKTMKKDSDLAINFLQIGDDPDATQYLKKLDDNLTRSHQLQFDAVNSIPVQESEGLSYEQIMWLALND